MSTSTTPRALWYVRVSSDGQTNDGTHETQIAVLRRFGESRAHSLVAGKPFLDLGVSAISTALVDRPGWQRAEAHITRDEVDEVWVVDSTRLVRDEDLRDSAHLMKLMRTHNFRVVEANTGQVLDLHEFGSKLMFLFKSLMGNEEAKKIRARTYEGRARSAATGGSGGTGLPTGLQYDRRARVWALDPNWARQIREIFELAVAGWSLTSIATELNQRGLAPPRSASWNPNSVRKLLHQPAYSGVMVRTFGGKRSEVNVPAVVDAHLWEAAQQALRSRVRLPIRKSYGVPAICRSVATCGVCGGRMSVSTHNHGRRDVTPNAYYRCPACAGLPYHRIEDVDGAVWAAIAGALDGSDDTLLNAVQSEGRDALASHEQGAAEAKKQLERIAAKRSGLTAKYTQDLLPESEYTQALTALKEQEASWAAKHAEAFRAQRTAEAVRQGQASLAAKLADLRGKIHGASWAVRKEIFDAIVPLGSGTVVVLPDRRIQVRALLPVTYEAPTASPRSCRTRRRSSGEPG